VLDLLKALNGATDAEVVITSEITTRDDNRLHFIRTETFYVRPSDVHLYLGGANYPGTATPFGGNDAYPGVYQQPSSPPPANVSIPVGRSF
jgi:hypothetical protein